MTSTLRAIQMVRMRRKIMAVDWVQRVKPTIFLIKWTEIDDFIEPCTTWERERALDAIDLLDPEHPQAPQTWSSAPANGLFGHSP
jgi:hypothetical protein